MPRSGTSLVTQLLHRCGFSVGPAEQLMPPSFNNTDGFWENLRFVRLNERLLAASGGTWFAPPPTLRPTAKITAEAQSILAQFEGAEPWLWKDPRNALTLPFWKTLLPSMKVVVCVRHPAETASSLVVSRLVPRSFYWRVTRARLSQRLAGTAVSFLSPRRRRKAVYELGLELWRIYNSRILEATDAADRLVVQYDATLTAPRAELERILAFAAVQVSSEAIDEAVGVVSPRMRHQRADAASLAPELAELYTRLSREAVTSGGTPERSDAPGGART
jgi:hypothetical protein